MTKAAKKQTKPWQARQGDVFLERIDEEIPKAAKLVRTRGAVVLADGSATGHKHQIKTPGVKHFRAKGEQFVSFVRADKAATLTHEEHSPIKLAKGTYRVTIQRQYTPTAIVRVED